MFKINGKEHRKFSKVLRQFPFLEKLKKIIEDSSIPVYVEFRTKIDDEIGFLTFYTTIIRRDKQGKVRRRQIEGKRDLWLVCNTERGYRLFDNSEFSSCDIYYDLERYSTDGPFAVLFHPEETDKLLLVVVKAFAREDLDSICRPGSEEERELDELSVHTEEYSALFCGAERDDPENYE